VTDCFANAALFYGLVYALALGPDPPEDHLPFATARDNFYRAARLGLDAQVLWLDGREHGLRGLFSHALLPLAREGLDRAGVAGTEAEHWLSIVAARIATGRTGAAWQRAFIARHGPDWAALTCAYAERSRRGAPVHEWVV
jgi:hypothetical protein